jgi:hypothetical protein
MPTVLTKPDTRATQDGGAHDNCARTANAEFREMMEDVRLWRNIHGPYATAEEAVRAMLED